jgi:hypothetical protein
MHALSELVNYRIAEDSDLDNNKASRWPNLLNKLYNIFGVTLSSMFDTFKNLDYFWASNSWMSC